MRYLNQPRPIMSFLSRTKKAAIRFAAAAIQLAGPDALFEFRAVRARKLLVTPPTRNQRQRRKLNRSIRSAGGKA
jgi:hypothetical protein